MAAARILLTTEQGDPTVLDAPLQLLDTIEERPGSLDPRIVHPAIFVVKLLCCRPSS